MKECLFKSGLEGPLFNAPPFLHTHTDTHSLSHTHAQVCAYIATHRDLCNFVISPHTLCCIDTICSPHPKICKIAETLPPNPCLTLIQLSLWVQDLGRIVCGSCADTSPSSILFPLIFLSSSNPSERASLFYSVCMWSLSFSSSHSVSLAAICLAFFRVSSSPLLVVSWIIM